MLVSLVAGVGSLAWLGRRPHTAEVAGSNPARPTKKTVLYVLEVTSTKKIKHCMIMKLRERKE